MEASTPKRGLRGLSFREEKSRACPSESEDKGKSPPHTEARAPNPKTRKGRYEEKRGKGTKRKDLFFGEGTHTSNRGGRRRDDPQRALALDRERGRDQRVPYTGRFERYHEA